MTEEERTALAALRLSWVQAPDDVWRRSPFHVDGLHDGVAQDVRDAIARAEESPDANPPGLVLEGRQGAGKTHLLGWVREQVQNRGGYFFLVGLLEGRQFWEGLLVFLLDGLAREAPAASPAGVPSRCSPLRPASGDRRDRPQPRRAEDVRPRARGIRLLRGA
jgi:hypothetical protein